MYMVDITHQHLMRAAFYQQLYERCRPDNNPERAPPEVLGVETEYLIVDAEGNLIPESVRNGILASLSHGSPELGSSTLETHTEPVSFMDAGQRVLEELERVEGATIEAARRMGCRLVRIGTYPGLFQDLAITQEPQRYQLLMDTCHAMHGESAPIQVGEITLPQERCYAMAGCQSIHLNIQLPAGQLAVQLLNKAIELVPTLVALGAHASIMNCQPSGFMEYRIPLWEPLFTFPKVDAQFGVDTCRTGLPDRYYMDWDDYWSDVGEKLFLGDELDRAFESNMKNFWRTVRIKPCPCGEHDCLLELRALSTQPTFAEDAAFYMLICALLHDRDWSTRPLLPMKFVQANLTAASKHALHAQLYVVNQSGLITRQPAVEVVRRLLNEASAIWRRSSASAADLVNLLRPRLDPYVGTPARASLRMFEHEVQSGHTAVEAAQHVLLEYAIETGHGVQRAMEAGMRDGV